MRQKYEKKKKKARSLEEIIMLARDSVMLERNGFYVIKAENYKTMDFAYKDGVLMFTAQKNGIFCMSLDCVDDFISELKEVADSLKDRKRMDLKGA